MFNGYEFIFANLNSSTYNLVISNLDQSGLVSSSGGADIIPIIKKLARNPIEYLYSVEQGPVLEFDLEFTSPNPISAIDRNMVASWLFGQTKRQHLQIVQDDLQNVYFNCLITKSDTLYIGNNCVGFKCHIKCDSPFAWENPRTITESFSGSEILNKTITLNNTSADAYYIYPTVSFTTSGIGSSFSITNNTDASRLFAFTSISAGETITVDCQKQILTSSTGLMRISKFNKNWLRFLPGVNSLSLLGGITNYTITYPVARKVGG